jgi:hypothetical protein
MLVLTIHASESPGRRLFSQGSELRERKVHRLAHELQVGLANVLHDTDHLRGWVEGHPGSRSQPIVLGEFDRPYGTLASRFGLAFLTDPWGTYIELTETLTVECGLRRRR